jgi:lipopolysaccharide transport system ATP-binding protein
VRLAFAVAVCIDPDVLIVDEVLAVGDALYQSRSYRRMEQMRDSGKTIILVSHDFYMVQSFCDRALLLDRGRVLKSGPAKPVVNKYVQLIATREQEYAERLASRSKYETLFPINHTTSAAPQITAIEQETIQEEFRFGTSEAEIIDHYLLDETGNRTFVWESGEVGTVVVVVKFHRAVERPVIGFVVNTPTGVNVFGANSWYADNEPRPQKQGAILRTEFRQRIRLNPGHYILSCGVNSRESNHILPLDRRLDVLSFKVTGPQLTSGLVDMGSTITYTYLSTGEMDKDVHPDAGESW